MKNPRIVNEIDLIKSAQAGDESAFSKLYNNYEKYVQNALIRWIHDEDLAKDLTVVTFMDAYENLSKFKDYSSFGGWLRTIAYRNMIDYLRKYDLNSSIDFNSRLLYETDTPTEDEFGIVDRITSKQIIEEFNKLPPQQKRIFELFYVEEMSIAEIGRMLDIPSGTVKSILSRVRKRLKKYFNK